MSANSQAHRRHRHRHLGLDWDWDRVLKSDVLSWDAQMYAPFGWPEDVTTNPHQLWSDHLHPDDKSVTMQSVGASWSA